MQKSDTSYEHIQIDEKGTAFIKNTNTKVVELISEQNAYGWSPEEIYFQHPYLSLAQIYSAFAYYWDHSEEINFDLSVRQKEIASFRTNSSSKLLQNKLKTQKAG
ncbi:MAG: DUF433 domain-containing protein [Ignavibacteriales bacterium]|nr:DUF433 domain-containing protein [Ignavibacteriales bacterium]